MKPINVIKRGAYLSPSKVSSLQEFLSREFSLISVVQLSEQ